MPLEVLAKNLSMVNFASARIGLLPFYRSCRIKANRFGTRWSRTIRWWLSRERLRPDDDPKKWVTPFPADYWRHALLPNAWEYTDPVSDVQSDMLQVDAGFKSPQMVIAERGRDAAKIIRERLEWQEQTKDLPRVHSQMTRDPMADPNTQPKEPATDGA
jgi:capsid protein